MERRESSPIDQSKRIVDCESLRREDEQQDGMNCMQRDSHQDTGIRRISKVKDFTEGCLTARGTYNALESLSFLEAEVRR